jgi:TRAP-type C4-dicarboxylate transport system substrate-binding protein
VDGTVTGYPAVLPFKFHEVTSWHLDAKLGGGAGMVIVAKKKFDALPAAARKLLDDNSGEALSRRYGATNDSEWHKGRAAVVAMAGHTVVAPTPEQHEMFKRKMAPLADEFAKSVPNGAAVVAKFRELLAQVEKER